MNKLTTYLTNFIGPSAGFSEGQFKDDPGDGTGSGAVVKTINDVWYGIAAIAKKYIGVISDTDESETASDMMDSIERAIGVKNENLTEYDNTATYSQDSHVLYLGVQFVSMVNSNTGNPPLDNPDKWLPCFNRDEAVIKWRDGENISGGFSALHNKRDVTNYRLLFQAGKYNFGGDSVFGSGRNFQATGLHLDGTTVTGNATLEALLDVGGAKEYHLLDVIAPLILGTRTIVDALGKTLRSVDDTGGDTEDIGYTQEDQFQGFQIEYGSDGTGFEVGPSVVFSKPDDLDALGAGTPDSYRANMNDLSQTIVTDGINGTPRIGDETRMKNYTVGVPYILIFQEL